MSNNKRVTFGITLQKKAAAITAGQFKHEKNYCNLNYLKSYLSFNYLAYPKMKETLSWYEGKSTRKSFR